MKEKEKSAAFWDARAKHYDRRLSAMPEAYRDMLSRCKARLKQTDTLLDLGCGTGQVSCALADAVQTIQACDLAPGMLDIAAAHAREMRLLNITFSQQEASKLDFLDASFDAALSLAVLHLMPRPETAMAELRRVIRPGGLLFFSTYLAGQSVFSRAGNALMGLNGYRDEQMWDAAGFLSFVKGQGFTILDSVTYPMFPIPMRFLICRNR